MIYTVTFNPSLDYVLKTGEFVPGAVNRASHEAIYPGGKGCNVSVVLSNLGVESKALGFAAGFTGAQLERMLAEYGCRTDFILLEEGFTRINVKIRAGEESEINGQGPVISPEALAKLYEKLERLVEGDILVLAGSIPNTLPEDMYERIMAGIHGKGIKVVVDATKDLLWNVLKYHPFLIKPNHHELGELFGLVLTTDEEIIMYAEKLQEQGARNVLVSMAGEGAVLVTENGEIHREYPPEGNVVNSVGAGDSMVAGFLAGYLYTGDYEKAFKLGLAAGSASAFSTWLAARDDVVKLLEDPAEIFTLQGENSQGRCGE